MKETLVLPLVPVIPATSREREGWPCQAAASAERAIRASSTSIRVMRGSGSIAPGELTITLAPRKIASSA